MKMEKRPLRPRLSLSMCVWKKTKHFFPISVNFTYSIKHHSPANGDFTVGLSVSTIVLYCTLHMHAESCRSVFVTELDPFTFVVRGDGIT